MRANIRQQTLLIALLPLVLTVILLDIFFLYARVVSMEESMRERASLLAKQIASTSEYALFAGNFDSLNREALATMGQKDVVAVSILEQTGKSIAYAGNAAFKNESEVVSVFGKAGVVLDKDDYFWVKETILAKTIELNEFDMGNGSNFATVRPVGDVLIKISKRSLQKEKWEVIGISLLISLLMFALTVIFVLRFSQRIVNPILALNRVVRRIGGGDLDVRVSPAPVINELNQLAQGINEMAKQLQQERVTQDEQRELLRSSEERLNEIITSMPVSLFIKDAQSRITLMNSACEAQWGVLFANVVNTTASQYFPPEQVVAFLADDKAVFAGRKLVNVEEQVWNSEIKQNRTLQTFKKPVYGTHGEPLYLICMSVDITARKFAEGQLRKLNEQLEVRIEEATRAVRLKKEDAENASYDKTRFLAAASHDLRQPMHALGLFVGELQSKLTSPDQTRLVGKIEESVDALSNLLDALLDISKLDAGVVTPNVTAFSIENLLMRIARDYGPLAEQKGVSLRVVPNRSRVQSDPILLERILGNLLSNAIRYTPVGGKVLLDCRYRSGTLCIEVRDNGIGIDESEQLNIFREFVQIANQERDRSKGLGLGLAIVSRISKLLGHKIAVRSQLDKGAVFSVFVPKVNAPEVDINPVHLQTTSVDKKATSTFEKLNVLIVDDDPLVRKSTQGIVESWGCRVSMAATLTQVKEVHNKADYDLVICDYRLPDGNGIEMSDWIQANFNIQPAFILISGDTSPEVLQSVNETGIHFLHQPVRPAQLRSLIQHLISEKAP
ncbi:MAG: ATP-binding protein [Gallionellaceae bacterium]